MCEALFSLSLCLNVPFKECEHRNENEYRIIKLYQEKKSNSKRKDVTQQTYTQTATCILVVTVIKIESKHRLKKTQLNVVSKS